jgi:hypothetical protein
MENPSQLQITNYNNVLKIIEGLREWVGVGEQFGWDQQKS